MLQSVIFDYDGTIAPTDKRQYAWFRHWAEKNSRPWRFQDVKDFMEFYNHHIEKEGSVQDVYDALNLPCNMKERTHTVWDAYTDFNNNYPQKLYPGMKDTIKRIWEMGSLRAGSERNRRMRMGINTTNTWKVVGVDFEKQGLLPYFDAYITHETLKAYQGLGNAESLKKPSPISIALILGLLDSPGNLTLHIGDTLNDLSSSQKIIRLNPAMPEKVITVGACYGFEGRDALERGVNIGGKTIKFDYLIDRPSELVGIVEKLL